MSALNNSALIGASGSTGYQISRSVRLRSSASAYFNRTFGSNGNQQQWTWSGWTKAGRFGSQQPIFNAYSSTTNYGLFTFSASGFISATDTLKFYTTISNVGQAALETAAVFRDPSAWYHVVLQVDTTQATSTNRIRIYVNGVLQTLTGTQPSQNANIGFFNTTSVPHQIGSLATGTYGYYDGYLTEVNFIDGQALTPSSFGETNPVTGVWQPKKYTGTYGTNGFYLNFSDNSGVTATTIGKDYSGNGNNFTPNNISVTAGVTYDSMLDVPTQWADGGNGRGNYAVMNPLAVTAANSTITNGNLQVVTPNVGGNAYATMGIPASGKWYFEVTPTSGTGNAYIGVSAYTIASSYLWQNSNHVFYTGGGSKSVDGSSSAYGASYTDNDVIGVACDSDASTITFYKNNVSQGSISHTMVDMFPALTDGASASGVTYQTNFGQRPFAYTPPSGFKALNTLNLPTPTILKGNQYFDVSTWTGDGASSRSITGVQFQPDLVWAKSRSLAIGHTLFDAVRGVGSTKALYSNSTEAEGGTIGSTASSQYGYVSSLNSDGFSVSVGSVNANYVNNNTSTYVGWQWKEGATQGFDIVTYTGDGVAGRTVAHNLGVAPNFIITKSRSGTYNWCVYSRALSANGDFTLRLNTTDAQSNSANTNNDTAPSSTVMTLGDSLLTNNNGSTYVAYLFSEVAGFSKFGSYTGNGSADGPFVFCGFRPRWVLWKNASAVGDWQIKDSSRSTYNVTSANLYADLSNAENSAGDVDFLSNGFKLRSAGTDVNGSGNTIIYAAFAENPFKNALAR